MTSWSRPHCSTGVIKSFSTHTFRVNSQQYRFTLDQTISFTECRGKPLSNLGTIQLSVSRNFLAYNTDNDNIVRFSQTNKIAPAGEAGKLLFLLFAIGTSISYMQSFSTVFFIVTGMQVQRRNASKLDVMLTLTAFQTETQFGVSVNRAFRALDNSAKVGQSSVLNDSDEVGWSWFSAFQGTAVLEYVTVCCFQDRSATMIALKSQPTINTSQCSYEHGKGGLNV